MNSGQVISCLNFFGIGTGTSGTILGLYSTDSGSGTSGSLNLIYNQLYSTGSHFSGNKIYGPNLPLIPLYSGNSGNFSGRHILSSSSNLSGDFSILMDLDYNGCARSTNDISFVLFSTADNTTGTTGTCWLGINDSNYLFFETSGYYKTLYRELHKNNLVYFSLGNRNNIEFGIFDVPTENLISEQCVLPFSLNSVNKLNFGAFFDNQNSSYTGFSGSIYSIVLANKGLELTGLKNCSKCLFATGQITGSPSITTVYVPSITGFYFSGSSGIVTTGITTYTGVITKSDGSTVNVVFPSGLTGLQQTEEIATLLTGATILQITGKIPVTYIREPRYNKFMTYDIEFDNYLVSGDTLEIYTYNNYNPSVNVIINENLDFPTTTGFVQLYGNGLAETNGIDYFVVKNQISGFTIDDILISDILSGQSLVSPFSGWWNRSKIQLSGGSYFPSTGQFNETIDTGRIILTGLSGQRLSLNHDFYLNGQKLVSGVHYKLIDDSVSGWFGGQAGLIVGVLDPEFLPDFSATPLYPITGGLPTGVDYASIEDSELTAMLNFRDFNKYYRDITGDFFVFSGVTGASEQIYVNGIRLSENIDYVKNYNCTNSSGFMPDSDDLEFKYYDGSTGYWNIE